MCGHREGGITERGNFRHILRAIKFVPVGVIKSDELVRRMRVISGKSMYNFNIKI